jgi:hypothetical protein
MIELPDELRQAVMEQAGKPVPLLDPATRETFVLVRSELYEQLARLDYDDGDQSVAEAYPLLDEMAAKAGRDNPAMDIYNDLAPEDPA